MRITLDGQTLSGDSLPDGANVGHVLDYAKTRLTGSDQLILSIHCDGEEIDAARLKGVLASPVDQFQLIELLSGSPYQAVLEALGQTRMLLSETFATVKQISDALAAGDLHAAMTGLVECVGAWSNVHEAVVQGGALVGVDFDRLVVGGRHILDWLNELNGRLRDIRDAIQSRDHVMLGDILRYEIDETMQGWETMLDGFIAHVEKISLAQPQLQD